MHHKTIDAYTYTQGRRKALMTVGGTEAVNLYGKNPREVIKVWGP